MSNGGRTSVGRPPQRATAGNALLLQAFAHFASGLVTPTQRLAMSVKDALPVRPSARPPV